MNKEQTPGQIAAQEREDKRVADLLESLIGRTILMAEAVDGESGPERFELTLDDARTITFTGWGHDWWGCEITEESA